MGVDDGQDAQLLSQCELIMDKIHRPDVVRTNGFLTVLPKLGLHRPLWVLFLGCSPNSLYILRVFFMLIIQPSRCSKI